MYSDLIFDVELLDVGISGAYVITDDRDNILRHSSSGGLLKIRRTDKGILVDSRLLARKSLYIKPTSFALRDDLADDRFMKLMNAINKIMMLITEKMYT